MAAVSNKTLLLSDLNSDVVPIHYIRPISERPNLTDVITSDIPIVDLRGIDGADHSSIVKAIGLACQSDGFFQVGSIQSSLLQYLAYHHTKLQTYTYIYSFIN